MGATDNLIYAVALVLSISTIFWLTQSGLQDVREDFGGNDNTLITCTNNTLSRFLTSDCSTTGAYALDSNINDALVPSDAEVNPSTGNLFTDTFTASLNWLIDSLGLGWLFDLLSAPTNFLIAIHVPSAIAYTLGAIFYAMLIIVLAAFILGRY